MNIYYSSYEDGTNTFPIIDNVINPFVDDLQQQINNNTSNLNKYLVELFEQINIQDSTYHLYLCNSNILGEIRFYTTRAYLNNANNYNYCTKIGEDGKLYIFHNYDPLVSIGYNQGWKDIDNELSQLFGAKNSLELSIISIGGLVTDLISFTQTMNAELQIVILRVDAIELNLLNDTLENLEEAIQIWSNEQNPQNLIEGYNDYFISSYTKFTTNFGNVIAAIGIGGSIYLGLNYYLQQEKKNLYLLDLIEKKDFNNLTLEEKQYFISYVSNVKQGEIYYEHSKFTKQLNENLGFTNEVKVETITNEVLDNFIDTNQTNTINYSSLNSYPSKIPTTINSSTTGQVLGQYYAKQIFNLDYTGISYGIGDYTIYYITASSNKFINCFDGDINTYGEFSSIYTDNIYDDFLNSQNVFSLGDFTDRGNILIIQLPYKISLNSITIRSASGLLGAPINYSIYAANDLDVFYKLHQTTDLIPATDYPSPNYINTQLLSQDSPFYNTFGFIFKKAYQQAPRIYELKLYGYEVSSRRTLLRNNVGIGTNIPDEKLHVIGNILNEGNIYTNNISTITLLTTGNIGIGITNPTEKLHIVGGNILCDGNTNTNTLTTNSINNIIYVSSNGNIGIGITNPNIFDKLQIDGDVLIKGSYFTLYESNKGYIKITPSSVSGILNHSGRIEFYNSDDMMVMKIGDSSGGVSNYLDILYNSPIVGLYNQGNFIIKNNLGIGHTNSLNNPSERLEVLGNIKFTGNIYTTTGNIGIGITNPSNKLEVVGTSKFDDITLSSYIDCNRNTSGNPSVGIYGSTADRILLKRGTVSTYPYSIGINNSYIYYNVPSTIKHSFMVNGIEKVSIRGSGLLVNSVDGSDILNIMNDSFTSGIGIGTNTISSISDVADSITIKSKLTGDINLNVNSNNKLTILGSNGYIGINTTSPSVQLEINGITKTNNYLDINYINPQLIIRGTAENQTSTLFLGTPSSSTAAYKSAIIAEGINSYGRAKIHFCLENTVNNINPTNNASLSNSRMTITNDGYVGIGSSIPITNLEVVGSINATSKYLCTNTNVGVPTIGTWGGSGDRLILYQGLSPTYHPYSLGINNGTLWYSVPTTGKHSFYINGNEHFTINTGGSINTVTNDTYIASFKKSDLTEGIGIKSNTIEAIGSNGTQNITIKSKSTGAIYLNTNGTSQLMVSGNGGVEIQNYLKIYSDTKTISGSTATYITNTAVNFSTTPFSAVDICAEFGSSIWIYNNIYISSDIRIKKDIIDLNSDDSLNKILQLKPKSFKYIDVINKGNFKNYGFIAQDVKEIIPEAVSYKKSFISNIYEVGIYDNGLITINKTINNILNIGDKLKIYDDKGIEVICNITEIINDNSFNIDNKKLNSNKVLVYGSEVDDYNILDKEILFSLNISATQKLNEKMNNLQKRIEELESYIKIIR